MSAQGLCQICEAAPADYQCRRCGALVCSAHYQETMGLCTACAAETTGDSGPP
jgi:hypothetical protein